MVNKNHKTETTIPIIPRTVWVSFFLDLFFMRAIIDSISVGSQPKKNNITIIIQNRLYYNFK